MMKERGKGLLPRLNTASCCIDRSKLRLQQVWIQEPHPLRYFLHILRTCTFVSTKQFNNSPCHRHFYIYWIRTVLKFHYIKLI